jgi:hypothetical protein
LGGGEGSFPPTPSTGWNPVCPVKIFSITCLYATILCYVHVSSPLLDATRPSHISWKGKKLFVVVVADRTLTPGMVWYGVLCRPFPTQSSPSKDTQMPNLNFWWVHKRVVCVCVWVAMCTLYLNERQSSEICTEKWSWIRYFF